MRTFNYLYKNKKALQKWVNDNKLAQYENILIQVFTGRIDRRWIDTLRQNILAFLPQARIIGATTDGEILKGRVTTSETVISVSVFEKSVPKTYYIPLTQNENSKELGVKVAEAMVTDRTKVVFVFGDGMYMEGSALLQGIHEHSPNVYIAGGNAGDNGFFKKIFLFTEQGVFNKGVVAAALDSDELYIHTLSYSEWKPAGKVFTVTGINDDGELELDGITVKELYTQYMGKDFAKNLPDSAVEYPLMIKHGKRYHPMAVLPAKPGEPILFHQKVKIGTKLQLGYRDASLQINSIDVVTKDLQDKPAEAIFMYSCMARRRYLSATIEKEFFAIDQFVPTIGFFSYGEYFHDGTKLEFLSHTLTLLMISESKDATLEKKYNDQLPVRTKEVDDLLALSHLIQTSTEEMEQLNDFLIESEQRYKSLFDHNPDMIYSMDLTGYINSVNPALVQTLGYRKDEILNTHALSFVPERDHEQVLRYFTQAIHDKPQTFVTSIVDKAGKEIVCSITNIPIVVNHEVVGIYGIGKNIMWQKKAEEKMERLAFHDSLTGLPNRNLFEKRLKEHLEEAKTNKKNLAVLFIDLDHFKMINESLGHHVGDIVLKHVSNQIRKKLKRSEFLCRFSGDEFTVILSEVKNPAQVIEAVDRILDALRMPIYLDGHEYIISASIGVSMYPNDGVDADLLIKHAGIALHKAKEKGRGTREFFTGEMNIFSIERLKLENSLRKALKNEEFLPYYQPQICMKTDRVIGFEALLRWMHPEQGLVPPIHFIPIAEEMGLIDEIGKYILFESCRQLKEWHEEGNRHLSISVNVSGRQFERVSFVYEVKEALEMSGIPAECLHLELTESMMIHNIEYSISIMQELKELGVKLSIDDFGTGYSSLSYLKDFPVDTLKIDQSFIRNLSKDYFNSSDAAIIKAIIMMCEGLDVATVAEGVETFDQMNLLKEYGCDHLQGYIISKPMPAEEATKFIKETYTVKRSGLY